MRPAGLAEAADQDVVRRFQIDQVHVDPLRREKAHGRRQFLEKLPLPDVDAQRRLRDLVRGLPAEVRKRRQQHHRKVVDAIEPRVLQDPDGVALPSPRHPAHDDDPHVNSPFVPWRACDRANGRTRRTDRSPAGRDGTAGRPPRPGWGGSARVRLGSGRPPRPGRQVRRGEFRPMDRTPSIPRRNKLDDQIHARLVRDRTRSVDPRDVQDAETSNLDDRTGGHKTAPEDPAALARAHADDVVRHEPVPHRDQSQRRLALPDPGRPRQEDAGSVDDDARSVDRPRPGPRRVGARPAPDTPGPVSLLQKTL